MLNSILSSWIFSKSKLLLLELTNIPAIARSKCVEMSDLDIYDRPETTATASTKSKGFVRGIVDEYYTTYSVKYSDALDEVKSRRDKIAAVETQVQ